MGALKCIAHWWCCGLCSLTKLHGSVTGQGCNIVPSCLFSYFCGPCAAVVVRNAYRQKSGTPGHIVGDIVCTWCCGACSFCQVLRAAPIDDWFLWPVPSITVHQPSMKLMA